MEATVVQGTSNAEELPIMAEENGNVNARWGSSKWKFLVLLSVILALNSTMFVYMAANLQVHGRAGPVVFTHALCAFRGFALLLTNSFAAIVIDYVGCYSILLTGSLFMFVSTGMFTFADAYKPLLAASILQGIVTALTDTTCLVIVAGVFRERIERVKAFAIMWSARYFGKLVLAPLTVLWCVFSPRQVLLGTYALVYLIIFMILIVCDKSFVKRLTSMSKFCRPSVSLRQLIGDGKVLGKMALLTLSSEFFALTYFPGGQPRWMILYLNKHQWTRIVAWLPSYVLHVLGAISIVWVTKKRAHLSRWMIIFCLASELICWYANSFIRSYALRAIPVSLIAFCIAVVDVAVLVSLAKHMENHYNVISYGAVYAMAGVAYSLAFSVSYLIESSLLGMVISVSYKLGKVIESMLNFPFLRRY